MSIVKYERITEPEELKSWAKEHDAQPAFRSLPGGGTQLTFNTDGNRDGEPVEWDAFLAQFRAEDLALLVEPDDSRSHYFKLVTDSDKKPSKEIGMSRSRELTKQTQNSDFRAK